MKIPNTKLRLIMGFLQRASLVMLAALFLSSAINAQTTLFQFQAKLPDSAMPATGIYEMEFRLFGTPVGGTQIGVTNLISNVNVENRNFTVWLDFGAAAFPGSDRFVEISYRRNTFLDSFKLAGARWQIVSVPYAIRALNATTADTALNLNGFDPGDFVQTTDPRLSDDRNPLPGSNNYIQNRTTQQPSSDFNISGTGTANVLNAATRFDIGGLRVLSVAGTGNLFAGISAGAANTTGFGNSFVGQFAGRDNTTGNGNSFVGRLAGRSNTAGSNNSFFGTSAGGSNTTGNANSFVGTSAGLSNTTGSNNSFFGMSAGAFNTTGNSNSFVGTSAGVSNTTGFNNSFVGTSAGVSNTTGSNNTSIGVGADVGSDNLSYATAIGALAVVRTNNTIVLGREDGSDRVRIFGLGAAGSTQLCRNADNEISTCSSSLRYKTNIAPFGFGLNLVNRLQPITFKWRDGGMLDLGFGAEDVAEIEPLLVTYNKDGQVEGVKYDRIGVVLINAVKEQQLQIKTQQTQIDEQKATIKRQQAELDALKKLVCSQNATVEFCKQQN